MKIVARDWDDIIIFLVVSATFGILLYMLVVEDTDLYLIVMIVAIFVPVLMDSAYRMTTRYRET